MLTKHEEIEKFILNGVIKGNYKPDEKVPSENKLAESFSVSRMTARKALDTLVTKGYLYKVKGKGTYVKDRENRDIVYLDEMIGFTKRVRRTGKVPKTVVKAFEKIKPGEDIAARLGITTKDEVYYIERVRYINDEPVILEVTYMPEYISPDLTIEHVQKSKYDYLREKGHRIEEMVKEYIPVIPESKVREDLSLDKNMTVFKIELISILEDRSIFEYTKLYYNQTKYRFLQITKNTGKSF
ncbi:GntR family transcriptional regulator [Ilyobacter sp.]|uniref:GntR family transcriptional regulator n=1 Tax=Ilyobacter sp. TaxID=3100343 RepID=UPI003564481D